MEVKSSQKKTSKSNRIRSSFECDSEAIDTVLGLCVLGNAQLRTDSAHRLQPPQFTSQVSQVYAPIEVVPKYRPQRDGHAQSSELQWELGSDLKRERLIRLLDRQQAWYDAEQQAAAVAERLLSLCEHHQQQWLPSQPNQPTQ